jgi:integrase
MAIKKVDSRSNKRVPGWRWDAARQRSWSWGYDIYIDGKRKERSGFYTEREAEADLIEERRKARNRKLGLATGAAIKLAAILEKHSPKISKKHQRTLFDRVSKILLSVLPKDIKVTELKKAHFQQYIDLRLEQIAKQTKRPVLAETIDKELYSISSALKAAPRYFTELEDYEKPQIPKAASGKKRRRERLVNKDGELDRLLAELRQPRSGKQTYFHETQRRRLADDLEFRFETGLRRTEAARLKKNQYFSKEHALRDVIRWKTGTVTKFFPLSSRAETIVRERIAAGESEFVFTADGEPLESDYRTLKNVCKKLKIPYGRFTAGGFVPHDLRHNFATEIAQVTDIETAKSLTGHSGNEIFTYLHTNEKLQREAVRKREKRDLIKEIVEIYKGVKRSKIKAKDFVEKIKFLMS